MKVSQFRVEPREPDLRDWDPNPGPGAETGDRGVLYRGPHDPIDSIIPDDRVTR